MTRLKYCYVQGKVRFPTFYAAWRVHTALNRKHHHLGGCVYHCFYCHDYHITHYDEPVKPEDLIMAHIPPNKKQKRSERNRMKREQRPINFYVILSKMRKIKQREVFSHIRFAQMRPEYMRIGIENIERASADIKNYMGACIGCTQLVYADMLDQLRKLPEFKNRFSKVRQEFNRVDKLWRQWEQEAVNPIDSKTRVALFTLMEFDDKSKNIFKEGATDRDYFDLVMGVGGQAYTTSWKQMMCLRHKFERLYNERNIQNGDILSWLDLVGMLLQLCVNTYNERTEHHRTDLCKELLYPTPAQLFAQLNIEPIVKGFFRARDLLPSIVNMPDETVRNLAITANDIRSQWMDFENLVSHIQQTCEDYDDVMASKAEIRRLKMETAADMARYRKERDAERLEEMKRKLEQNNPKEQTT